MWTLLHDWKLKNMTIENNRMIQNQLCIYFVIRIWCFFFKLFRWKSNLRSKNYSSLILFFIYYHLFFFIWFFSHDIFFRRNFFCNTFFFICSRFSFFSLVRFDIDFANKFIFFVRFRWCIARQSRSFSFCIRFSLFILSFTFSHKFCFWYVFNVFAMTWLFLFRSTINFVRNVRR